MDFMANPPFSWRTPKWLTVFVPLLVAALPSVLLTIQIAPLYTDLTLVNVVITPASGMPHYPPLYPYFAWAVHKVANAICGQPAGLSDCGLYSLVFLQQVLFVVSLLYFAMSCAETMIGRVIAISPFYLLPVFVLINQGFQTESIWLSCLILMLGATYRIARRGEAAASSVVVLTLSFTAAMLVRPTTILIAPIVPIVLGSIAIIERRSRMPRSLAIVLLMMGAGVGAAYATSWVAMDANRIQPRAVWGRGTIEVIQRIVVAIEQGSRTRPPQSRTTLIPRLESHAHDALLRNAVPNIMRYLDATYDGKGKAMTWGGVHYALVRLGTRDAAGRAVSIDFAQADKLVNEFCVLFAATYPRLWIRYAAHTTSQYLSDITHPSSPQAAALIESGLYGRANYLDLMTANFRFTRWYSSLQAIEAWRVADLILMQSRPQPRIAGLDTTQMATRPVALMAEEAKFLRSRYMRFTTSIADWEILAALVVIILAGWITKRLNHRVVIIFCSTIVGMMVYVLAVATLLAHLPRYDIPYELLLTVVSGYGLSALWSGCEPIKIKAET